MEKRLRHGVFGYSRWQHKDFLSAVRDWYRTQFADEIDTDFAVYGPSVIYMVGQLIQIWSQENDGIVTLTPCYDAFFKTIAGNKRQLVSCPLLNKSGKWQIDMTKLEALLAKPTNSIFLLCSPHNPTGRVWTREELMQIANLCKKYQVKVISDEIHMDMVWQKRQHSIQ